MNFPADFSTSKITVTVNANPTDPNAWFQFPGISFTLDNPSSLTGSGSNNETLTAEQALDAVVHGAKEMARKLAEITGSNLFLYEGAVTVNFMGQAASFQVISSEEETE